ncbi:hypothetical protein LSH36_26g15125 [Paralvinella palmiformis]|uniref:Uncharacterized protein n=1 Tax=Paralvinella palmiformis TaxID=53620 RepID=A0AAD9KA99_9ANNE|nr:hypothetical protein LSH36_26g15125 [Paralvinella palmiformis]
MASFGEPDDSLFELHRQSLLDIVEDRNRALNKVLDDLSQIKGSCSGKPLIAWLILICHSQTLEFALCQ